MTITVEVHQDSVAVFTINRPERRNALNHAMLSDLREALRKLDRSAIRALILTGAGQNFCAGADISTVEDGTFVDELRGLLEDLRALDIPVIAAMRGPSLGAGTQLAMACDLRLATDDATFGIPAAKLGLTIDHYTVHHLANEVGHSIARAMLIGAEVFGAPRLTQTGFIHRLISDDADLIDAALSWASDVSKLAPLTMVAHKVMLAADEIAAPQSPESVNARARAWQSADLREGQAAFAERRSAHFTGN